MSSNNNDDFERREESLRASWRDQALRANALRSKDREFHGLDREFRYYQAQIISDYERTKDLKHPRDMGNARENILRSFLKDSGYLPKRYAVSELSVRVVSTTGHTSNEIDIALFDPIDSLTLMKREGVYEAHPIESVFGVIQVKSNLTKKELRSGLKNLASFKKLDRPNSTPIAFQAFNPTPLSKRGFAVLFAYKSDMAWKDIVKELEAFAHENPPRNWPNAVFIMDRGFFLFGQKDSRAFFKNEEIEQICDLQMYGYPDREGFSLYQFQSLLLELLRSTSVNPAQLDPYFKLPLNADELSYSFHFGMLAEIGKCERHGDFARKLTPTSLNSIVQWCRSIEPINAVKATHLTFGIPENEEAYRRQPGMVHIYNPEGHPLSDILARNQESGDISYKAIAYDSIETAGMAVWVPYYYSIKEGLINLCPECAKSARPKRARKPKTD
jgi:hypothetical protein